MGIERDWGRRTGNCVLLDRSTLLPVATKERDVSYLCSGVRGVAAELDQSFQTSRMTCDTVQTTTLSGLWCLNGWV